VDGHFYSGYLRRSFSNADSASQWVKNLLGASIEIRYDLQAPWHSMLLEEDLLLHGTPAAELVRGA
jgi:hypothetical protein